MPVDLQLTLTDDQWQTLVELSHACNDKTVADTVVTIVLEKLRDFLRGKQVGLNRGHELAMQTVDRVFHEVQKKKV